MPAQPAATEYIPDSRKQAIRNLSNLPCRFCQSLFRRFGTLFRILPIKLSVQSAKSERPCLPPAAFSAILPASKELARHKTPVSMAGRKRRPGRNELNALRSAYCLI
ncbi:MAG: hypothetical protein DU430_03780 [Candidatus Tokpelaia sp.]|nr:MAG: hypothetical protein DU430_03780 [Candidatus Tokpelaia sp.]